MCWDVPVIIIPERSLLILAESQAYVNGAAIEDCAAADVASSQVQAYTDLESGYISEPIAVETLSVCNFSACLLLSEIGKIIYANTGESRAQSLETGCSNVPQC